MTIPGASSCGTCGEPVAAEAGPAGSVRVVHANPPADGHEALLPSVTVTYAHDGIWTDVSCPELGGHLGTVTDQGAATALAWTCLRRLQPPRGVREVHAGSAGS